MPTQGGHELDVLVDGYRAEATDRAVGRQREARGWRRARGRGRRSGCAGPTTRPARRVQVAGQRGWTVPTTRSWPSVANPTWLTSQRSGTVLSASVLATHSRPGASVAAQLAAASTPAARAAPTQPAWTATRRDAGSTRDRLARRVLTGVEHDEHPALQLRVDRLQHLHGTGHGVEAGGQEVLLVPGRDHHGQRRRRAHEGRPRTCSRKSRSRCSTSTVAPLARKASCTCRAGERPADRLVPPVAQQQVPVDGEGGEAALDDLGELAGAQEVAHLRDRDQVEADPPATASGTAARRTSTWSSAAVRCLAASDSGLAVVDGQQVATPSRRGRRPGRRRSTRPRAPARTAHAAGWPA